MNGLNHWWQKHMKLRKLLREYKEEFKISGDVFECVEHLLNNIKKVA